MIWTACRTSAIPVSQIPGRLCPRDRDSRSETSHHLVVQSRRERCRESNGRRSNIEPAPRKWSLKTPCPKDHFEYEIRSPSHSCSASRGISLTCASTSSRRVGCRNKPVCPAVLHRYINLCRAVRSQSSDLKPPFKANISPFCAQARLPSGCC